MSESLFGAVGEKLGLCRWIDVQGLGSKLQRHDHRVQEVAG